MERDPAESPEFDEALQLAEFIDSRGMGDMEKGEGEREEQMLIIIYLEGKQLWAFEDVTMRKPDIQSAQELSSLVNRVVGVLGEEGDLNEKWAAEGMKKLLFSFYSTSILLLFYFVLLIFFFSSTVMGYSMSRTPHSCAFIPNLQNSQGLHVPRCHRRHPSQPWSLPCPSNPRKYLFLLFLASTLSPYTLSHPLPLHYILFN